MFSVYSYLDLMNVCVTDDCNVVDEFLRDCDNLGGVGFDTESKPLYNQSQSHILSLIQISGPKNVLIYRVFGKILDEWSRMLVKFLEGDCKKFCVDSRQDEELLRGFGIQTNSFVDLQDPNNRLGMKTLAKRYLNVDLDKSKNTQAGDWSRWPLSCRQITYAASDAVISLSLAEKMGLIESRLKRYQPKTTQPPKSNSPEDVLAFVVGCLKYRKKEFGFESGFVELCDITSLPEFRRYFVEEKELMCWMEGDMKKRFEIDGMRVRIRI